jgi:starvation-inducible outer membrane lipoprotein
MTPLLASLAIFSLLISACNPQLFPQGTLDGVDHNFNFSLWRTFPNQGEQQKVELGGRIVQSATTVDTVTIVALELPIVEHPVYGPMDNKKRSGQFAILYQGKIDSLLLQEGNRLIVVGHTRPPIRVEVDDILRSLPTVTAQCIHLWNTGGKDIADFAASGAGNELLREETYCATSP